VNNKEKYLLEARIDAYRRGELSDEQIDKLWEELIEYPEYLDYLKNSVNLEAIATEEDNAVTDAASARRNTRKSKPEFYKIPAMWGRVAATLLVIAGVLSVVYLFGSDYIFEPKPMKEIELDTYRSSTIPSAEFDRKVQEAINLASLEKYHEALQKLEEMEENELTTEQIISLHINKGSIHYNSGDYLAAKDVFHGILDEDYDLHVLTREKVHWFLGNTYLQLEEEGKAQQHIKKTYELNGAYRRLAERYMD